MSLPESPKASLKSSKICQELDNPPEAEEPPVAPPAREARRNCSQKLRREGNHEEWRQYHTAIDAETISSSEEPSPPSGSVYSEQREPSEPSSDTDMSHATLPLNLANAPPGVHTVAAWGAIIQTTGAYAGRSYEYIRLFEGQYAWPPEPAGPPAAFNTRYSINYWCRSKPDFSGPSPPAPLLHVGSLPAWGSVAAHFARGKSTYRFFFRMLKFA